ncbi:MAG: hypothetical protein KKH98_15880, partial [Spirochaetes bacterium]|nr:hypothetical protein [Spirochaetota bacterium]
KKLFFYARGEKGGEVVEFKVGGITGQYSDSAASTTGTVELTKKWQLFEIDLEGLDLTYINGGFCTVFASTANPDGCTFYIDEVHFTEKAKPEKLVQAKEDKK